MDVIPVARPSLRDMHSPQPHAKSTMEEDGKRHSAPDSPPPPRRHKEKVDPLAFYSFIQNHDDKHQYLRPTYRSYLVEKERCCSFSFFVNIYKHIPMQHSQKSPPVQPPSHRRSLHRTLSDESIYRGQRLPPLTDSVTEPTLGSDVLFSCSTLPRSPTTRGVPLRRPSYKLGVKLHGKNEDGGCRH